MPQGAASTRQHLEAEAVTVAVSQSAVTILCQSWQSGLVLKESLFFFFLPKNDLIFSFLGVAARERSTLLLLISSWRICWSLQWSRLGRAPLILAVVPRGWWLQVSGLFS